MLKLVAEKREIFGSKLGVAREKGKLPVVVYGPKKETTSLFVSTPDFKKVWQKAGESTIVTLEIDKKPIETLIHDVAVDPVSEEPLHADFYAAAMDKPVKAEVPLEFEGVSPAVKGKGAVLLKVFHSIEVEALPKDLPKILIVNIEKLDNIGDNLTVSDIKLPSGVHATMKLEETIAVAEAEKEEVIEEKEVQAPALEEIEVEKKGKEETSEGEEEAETSQGK